jgi:hypothetical protein
VAAQNLAPLIEQVVTTIGDIALAKILEGDTLDRVIAAKRAEATANG